MVVIIVMMGNECQGGEDNIGSYCGGDDYGDVNDEDKDVNNSCYIIDGLYLDLT